MDNDIKNCIKLWYKEQVLYTMLTYLCDVYVYQWVNGS